MSMKENNLAFGCKPSAVNHMLDMTAFWGEVLVVLQLSMSSGNMCLSRENVAEC